MANKALDQLKDYTNLLENEDYCCLESSEQRIDFIVRHVKPLKEYRAEIHSKAMQWRVNHQKNEQKSMDLRSDGIKCFKEEDYSSALFMFTKAILSAPIPSETNRSFELSLAFASRSIVNFQLKNYWTALSDANHSIDLYETIEMLFHRIHCLRLMNRFSESLPLIDQIVAKAEDSNSVIALNDNRVEELQDMKRSILNQIEGTLSAISALDDQNCEPIETTAKESDESDYDFWIHPNYEIKRNDRKGRHVVARRDIPNQTIVSVERPQSVVLFGEKQLTVCCNCHQHIGAGIWPCIGCDEVVFCDKSCFTEAYEEYHKYECGFKGLLFHMGPTCLHAYRMMSRVGIKCVLECEQHNDFNFLDFESPPKPAKESIKREKLIERYKGFHSLIHHNSKYDKYANLCQSFNSIETTLLFDFSQQLDFDINLRLESFVKLADITIKNMRRVPANVFGWYENLHLIQSKRTHVANGICAYTSLINHSCDPNLYWYFIDRKLCLKAIRNISAGEEMCITYGPTSYTKSFVERQQGLKWNYFFDCNCSACLRECKTVLALRCHDCNGPVIYSNIDPKAKPKGSECHVCCLLCGNEFQNIRQTVAKLEANQRMFEKMLKNFEINYNKEFSLETAEKAIKIMIEMIYKESEVLLDYMRQLVRAYVQLGRSDRAIEYSNCFIDSINSDSQSTTGLDDLLLFTNCYYLYLNGKSVDSKHWDMAFDLYSKLIQRLKKKKKSWKRSQKKKKLCHSEEEVDSEDREENILELMRTAIKEKKTELRHLMDLKSSVQ